MNIQSRCGPSKRRGGGGGGGTPYRKCRFDDELLRKANIVPFYLRIKQKVCDEECLTQNDKKK